jgi:hypothetical protein
MAAPAPRCITLDVSALPPDVVTIDALARLELAARRGGLRFRLHDASDQLRDLIAFVGLSDVLGTCAADGERIDRSVQTDARAKPVRPDAGIASDALGVEPRRQAEEREQGVGVEEERELGDPAA